MEKSQKKLLIAVTLCMVMVTFLVSPMVQAYAVANPVDKSDHDRRNAPNPKITYEQAKEIALREVDGDYVKNIELEYKDRYGEWVYEVEVIKNRWQEYEVYVSGETGKVLRVKKD